MVRQLLAFNPDYTPFVIQKIPNKYKKHFEGFHRYDVGTHNRNAGRVVWLHKHEIKGLNQLYKVDNLTYWFMHYTAQEENSFLENEEYCLVSCFIKPYEKVNYIEEGVEYG